MKVHESAFIEQNAVQHRNNTIENYHVRDPNSYLYIIEIYLNPPRNISKEMSYFKMMS